MKSIVFIFVGAVTLVIGGCEPRQASQPQPKQVTSTFGVDGLFENTIGMSFKLIPAGEFTMGSTSSEAGRESDEAQRRVWINSAFAIGVHEVTQSNYKKVMGDNPSDFEGANNPVENVSWNDAVKFCAKLSTLPAERAAGRIYRLPTEAEWEYACRGGTTTAYCFGDDAKELSKYGWFDDNSWKTTHAVGEKLPNGWGLYDMHGNVWEWCTDKFGSDRVIRGGSWGNAAINCRAAYRNYIHPTFRAWPDVPKSYFGFRIALTSQTGE